jgi:ribonuclease Z
MFGTFVFFPTDHLCLDMGDGLVSSLGHKLVGIDTVLLSHAHRDHIAGIPMFLNVRCNHEGRVRIYYPAEAPLIPTLQSFCERFERKATPDRVEWIGIHPGEYRPQTKKNLFILPFATDHYRQDDGRVRSLGYHLCLRKMKVRADFRGKTTDETHALIRELGRDAVLEEVEEKYLSYSGDTAPLAPDTYAGSKVLVHEATFLNRADRDDDDGEARWHRHSVMEDVFAMAVEAGGIEHLALYHFSSRYGAREVMRAVGEAIDRFRPEFEVSVAPPGRFVTDLLAMRVGGAGESRREAAAAGAESDGDGEEGDAIEGGEA